MSGSPAPDEDRIARLGGAVSADLEAIAALHAVEPDAATIAGLCAAAFPECLGLRVASMAARGAGRRLADALAALGRDPAPAVIAELAADFADIYLLNTLRASPEESVWFSDEGCTRQLPMFEVREVYRRHRVRARDWRVMADNHLVPLAQAHQIALEHGVLVRRAQEHVELAGGAFALGEQLTLVEKDRRSARRGALCLR